MIHFGRKRLPRIRGGVSELPEYFDSRERSSPHTRGCFCPSEFSHIRRGVFPAYAGVFLTPLSRIDLMLCLPRIRGGVSRIVTSKDAPKGSSPHTRGCFSSSRNFLRKGIVFPAYAGVFPASVPRLCALSGLPRIRGGVSCDFQDLGVPEQSSPHTRGCFLRQPD